MMKGYGQFCPIAKASEVLGERWTNLVIRELIAGSESFNDLRRGLPLISPSLLSARLKSLERADVVKRTVCGKNISYRLTESGEELKPIIMQLGVWGHRWARSDLSAQDLDPSLLMWDIHRNLDAEFFSIERTVLLFEFADYTSKYRRWWLVIKDRDVDVCLKDPGYEIKLHIFTDLKTLTGVWMGDLSLRQALRNRLITVTGKDDLKRGMSTWLGTNYFADVKPVRTMD
ncbi:MAG: helix-turn-helix transcriptional regulator [Candidatus Thiodiazotropha sp. (ex Codakia rugifera)]|nr:helix-turn-helix transcriptional regulator [Candidatus Thiodiazotropha sp. (ex Codakia rugifera)]